MTSENDSDSPCAGSEKKRPPNSGMFKTGHSGNPAGRPKGSVNLVTKISQNLRKSKTITVNGKPLKMNWAGIVVEKLFEASAKGNLKATSIILQAEQLAGALSASVGATAEIPRLDKAALKRLAARALRLAEEI